MLKTYAQSGSSRPGGSDTQVQFNDGGVFGGSSKFTFAKTTGLATLTPGSVTVGTPSAMTVAIQYDETYARVVDGTGTYNLKVYSYRTDPLSGRKIYSSSFTQGSDTSPASIPSDSANAISNVVYDMGGYDLTAGGHGGTDYNFEIKVYSYKNVAGGKKVFSTGFASAIAFLDHTVGATALIEWTWDAVVGADGYRVFVQDDFHPYFFDAYVDVVTNALTDANDQTWIAGTYAQMNYRVFFSWSAGTNAAGYKAIYKDGIAYNYTGAILTASTSITDNNDQTFSGDLTVTPTSYLLQALSAVGYVGINATPTEMLDVGGNTHISGELVLGTATVDDGNSGSNHYQINLSETYTGSASVVAPINIVETFNNTSGSPSIKGINISITVPNTAFSFAGLSAISASLNVAKSGSGITGLGFSANTTGSAVVTNVLGASLTVNSGSSGNSNSVTGAQFVASLNSANTVTTAVGGSFSVNTQSSSPTILTTISAMKGNANIQFRATVTNVYAIHSNMVLVKNLATAPSVTTAVLFFGELTVTSVTPTNLYGLYLPDITGGTNNYAIYSLGGQSYHVGKFGINVSSPATQLHVIATSNLTRLGYDASNYVNIDVSSAGVVTFDAVGASAGFTFSDDITLSTKNLITDTTTGTKIATGTTQKLGFWNATPVVQQTGWGSITNVTTDRVYDANATTIDELADVLGTLVNDLKTYGILGA